MLLAWTGRYRPCCTPLPGQDCIVCQEPYAVGATLIRLPCGHLYHEVRHRFSDCPASDGRGVVCLAPLSVSPGKHLV